MTTFEFTISLDEFEADALRSALDLLIKQCNQELSEGADDQVQVHKRRLNSIRKKLADPASARQMSETVFYE